MDAGPNPSTDPEHPETLAQKTDPALSITDFHMVLTNLQATGGFFYIR